MRRLACTLLMVATLVAPLLSSEVVVFESITVSTTAIGITSTTTDPAGRFPTNRCSFTSETADVRYRWDGTDPTATVGQFLAAGATLLMATHEDAVRVRFIRDAGTDATLQGHCWLEAAS